MLTDKQPGIRKNIKRLVQVHEKLSDYLKMLCSHGTFPTSPYHAGVGTLPLNYMYKSITRAEIDKRYNNVLGMTSQENGRLNISRQPRTAKLIKKYGSSNYKLT